MENLKRILLEAGVRHPNLRKVQDIVVFDGPGGNAAIELWEKLRSQSSNTDYWPVLLGGNDDALDIEEQFEVAEDGTAADILKAAARIDAKSWFKTQMKERLEEFKEYNPGEPEDAFAPEGDWPKGARPNDSFSTPFDILSRQPHAKIN